MMQEAEGRTIQPLISAEKIVPSGYATVIRIPPVWNGCDDDRLLSLVAENGGNGN
jgi:hypothetical protein